MKIALIHAYSSDNIGDGFLVDEAKRICNEAFPDSEYTLIAHRPETFTDFPGRVTSTAPQLNLVKSLRQFNLITSSDLVVAVGGGYLRSGTPSATIKMLLIHYPQLYAATLAGRPAIYMPQSIGPLGFGTRAILRARLSRAAAVYLRDDRSVHELRIANSRRCPDLALLALTQAPNPDQLPQSVPVLSVRAVKGHLPDGVRTLAGLLSPFDGFVQSTTGKNNDTKPMTQLAPRTLLSRADMYGGGIGGPRVVVAVRLHAALLALAAGHYVIHLSYERKGYGAFQDLGLDEYAHRFSAVNPTLVASQVEELMLSRDARAAYSQRVSSSLARFSLARMALVRDLRRAVA